MAPLTQMEVVNPEVTELEAKISSVIAEAEAAVIVTREDYDRYDRRKAEITKMEKEGLEIFDHKDADPAKQGICASTYAAWKSACALRDRVCGRYTEAKQILSRKMGAWWNAEQERLAEERRKQEEQARADEVARLKAEGATKKEVEAVKSGKVAVPLPPAPVAAPTVGRKPVVYWSAEVTDKMALVKAVAAGKVPLMALEANMTYLNGQAKLLKSEFAVPGVAARKETRA